MIRKLNDGADVQTTAPILKDVKYYMKLDTVKDDFIKYSFHKGTFTLSLAFKGYYDLLNKLEIEYESFENYTKVTPEDSFETIMDYEEVYEDYIYSLIPETLSEVSDNIASGLLVFIELWI